MQIITGKYRARKLLSLNSDNTRPTLAKVKESMFSMLDEHLEGAVVLDLFAGSGALGIEALSRGAKKVYFVDNNKEAKKVIELNLRNVKEDFEIDIMDFCDALDNFKRRGICFDVVLLDPPYSLGLGEKALELLDKKKLLSSGAIVAFEQNAEKRLHNVCDCYIIKKVKKHGIALVTILEYRN